MISPVYTSLFFFSIPIHKFLPPTLQTSTYLVTYRSDFTTLHLESTGGSSWVHVFAPEISDRFGEREARRHLHGADFAPVLRIHG